MNVDTRHRLTNKKICQRQCFSCGSLVHILKYCRESNASGTNSFIRTKQPSTTKTNEDHRSGSIGVSKLANEAGMFIKAKVNGLNATVLVDTGATVTLVSIKLFESITSPVMTEMKREILTASRSKLNVLGKTIIDIDINGYVCSNVAIVADINVDGILGLDLHRSQHCTINVAKGSILIQGHEVCLQFDGQIGCYRIAMAETVNMPPRSEIIVKGNIKDTVLPFAQLGIVEPTQEFVKSDKGLLGRTLVEVHEQVPLRIMILSQHTQTIHMRTVVANLSPVEKIMSSIQQEATGNNDVPTHLNNLYEDTVKDMSINQKEKVRDLLYKNSDIFSQNDSDFGRTTLVRHSIETHKIRPHKEPPRRVSFHLRGEIDEAVDGMF